VARPLDRKPEETRRRLVEAAIDHFARYGLHGASSRELARAAGVNVAIVNYHFRSKEGLYDAAVDEVYRRMRARAAGALRETAPDDLFAVLRNLYRALRRERDGVRLLLRQVVDSGHLTARTVTKHFVPELERVAEMGAALLGTSPRRARTAVVAVSYLLTRYLIQDDRSLAVAFGVSGRREVEPLVLESLAGLARTLIQKEKSR
jgi:AcrR family transcriptional regulator